jgi:hypothetical protein
MTTLSEYFDRRAREILTLLDQQLRHPPVDPAALHRMVRELRGTAQMAREEHVVRATASFEAVARRIAHDALDWSEALLHKARATVADLRELVDRGDAEGDRAARADAVVKRWDDALPAAGSAHPVPATDEADQGARDFRDFAAREVAAIADVLDASVQRLSSVPMDRLPLRAVLQRQRALLGAARLDDVPVVAEILRAVEDLTRVIVKLDVGVKEEWLDIYRVARDGLRTSTTDLAQGLDPQPSNALRRIRHLRSELMERYGAGEIVSPAAGSAGLVAAATVNVPPEHPALADASDSTGDDDEPPELLLDEAVDTEDAAADEGQDAAAVDMEPEAEWPIGDLVYSGDSALERALALREVIDRATAHDPIASDAVDELFDLIRLARS